MPTNLINNLSDKVTLSQANLPEVDTANKVNNNDNVSELEMMKKLMQLIVVLQEIQQFLTGSTTKDLNLIADQGQSMQSLAQIEKTMSDDEIQKTNAQLDKKAHESVWQKVLGGIAAGIMTIIGAVMIATGNVVMGALMMGMGIMAIVSIASPTAIDDAINAMSGGNEAVSAALKTVILVAVTAVACVAGGPAAGIMMFAMMFATLNPVKDYATLWYMNNDNVDKKTAEQKVEQNSDLQEAMTVINIVLAVIAFVSSFGMNTAEGASQLTDESSSAAKTASSAAKGSKAAVQMGEDDIEMDDLSSTLSDEANSIESPVSANNTLENVCDNESTLVKSLKAIKSFLNNFKKMIQGILQILQSGVQGGNDYVSIEMANITKDLSKIKKEYAALQAATTSHSQTTGLIKDATQIADDFLQNLQSNYRQVNEQIINKLFIDQTEFANMLAQIA